jgi:hypothetical protein
MVVLFALCGSGASESVCMLAACMHCWCHIVAHFVARGIDGSAQAVGANAMFVPVSLYSWQQYHKTMHSRVFSWIVTKQLVDD